MKREIKFRAWDEQSKQMISPDYITRTECAFWKENSIPTFSRVIMQYTGLKDKNGVEIYEGDILRDKTDTTYTVEYLGCEFVRNNRSTKINLLHSLGYLELEIIGNIHQTPELL